MFKRSGGKGLVFYDVYADGFKLQVFADARNFSDFQDGTGLERFMKQMNETKLGCVKSAHMYRRMALKGSHGNGWPLNLVMDSYCTKLTPDYPPACLSYGETTQW